MLIVALVLAVIGLTALVTAVVTSNEVVAWVCIAASALGVILLVVDAIRERQTRRTGYLQAAGSDESHQFTEYVDDKTEVVAAADGQTEVIETVTEAEEIAEESSPDGVTEDGPPDEIVHDEPEYDTYSDDEPEYPQSAEEAAVHTVDESELDPEKTDER